MLLCRIRALQFVLTREDVNMNRQLRSLAAIAALVMTLVLSSVWLFGAEADAQRYLDEVRRLNATYLTLVFVLEMPKGGDLHNHLAGAIYAESLIDWAVAKNSCVDPTNFTLSAFPCASPSVSAAYAYKDPVLYRNMVDAYSMRNWQLSGQSGHDHFFDTFAKYGDVTGTAHLGKMLAETGKRASSQHEIYQELMFAPTGDKFSEATRNLKWDDKKTDLQNFTDIENALRPAMAGMVQEARDSTNKSYDESRVILGCDKRADNPGCEITQRYLFQVGRGKAKEIVFAQILLGFEMARADQHWVGMNLVMPEDYYIPMRDFSVQMQMLKYLRSKYKEAHITLHAGELVEGLIPPEGLKFHIRESVEIGAAERIGHGVDILNENGALQLLGEMAQKPVMVEICLTSNATILGISGTQHPLHEYMDKGVPVALATDDEGVSRSDMSHEYLRGIQDQNLSYLDLKRMARNSLEYSFIQGASLWGDRKTFEPAKQCGEIKTGAAITQACRTYASGSKKAALQLKLEEQFRAFEAQAWIVTAFQQQPAK
jgi:hypothetical protein